MATEQGLYTHVIMLRWKYLKFVATDKKTNGAILKFQVQSAISQCWFDLDIDWIEVHFNTQEPDFYNKPFQSHDDTQDINTFKFFQVPIGNKKSVELLKFHNDDPILKYCHKSLKSCCLSGLSSDFASIYQNKAEDAIPLRIEASLESEVGNRIVFANAILKNEKIIKDEPKLYYNLVKYKKKGSYDILKDISGNVTLVQLMDSLGNVNHAITVVGY